MDSPYPRRRTGLAGDAGEAASQQPAGEMKDAEVVLVSSHDAALKIGSVELDFGRGTSSILHGAAVRPKRRKNTNYSSWACAGHASSTFLRGMILLLATSFTSNIVMAQRNRRHTAYHLYDRNSNSAGLFKRILQGGKESNGSFDKPSGSKEGSESAGGTGKADGGGKGGGEEAWLQSLQSMGDEPSETPQPSPASNGLFDKPSGSNEDSESAGAGAGKADGGGKGGWLQLLQSMGDGPSETPQSAPDGGSCKHQLFISLVYDSYPDFTEYELAKIGSTSIFSHTGAESSESSKFTGEHIYHPSAVSAEYATRHHAYDQNVCMNDGDYAFAISGEFWVLFN